MKYFAKLVGAPSNERDILNTSNSRESVKSWALGMVARHSKAKVELYERRDVLLETVELVNEE